MPRPLLVHWTAEEPTGKSRCGYDVVLRSPRLEKVTCKKCKRAWSKAYKAEYHRRARHKHYWNDPERSRARTKAYLMTDRGNAKREAWLKENRWRVYEYQAKSRKKRKRRMKKRQQRNTPSADQGEQ